MLMTTALIVLSILKTSLKTKDKGKKLKEKYIYHMNQAMELIAARNKVEHLEGKLASQHSYIANLAFFMQERNGLYLPSAAQLRRDLQNQITQHLLTRPTPGQLRQKNILSADYMAAPEAQRQVLLLSYK